MIVVFYLGVHEPSWLGRAGVPLFVSRHRLNRLRRTLPVATSPWALDSGAFSTLRTRGGFDSWPHEYAVDIRRYAERIGRLEWAAPQDWMCEPEMLRRTGRTIREHQALTLANFLTLRSLDLPVPVIPVLQGWVADEYLRHADDYARAGVALDQEPLVGVGTVCRRQAMRQAEAIIRPLARQGLRLHGFGVKITGLARFADALASADSLAWSFRARQSRRQPGCTEGRARTCANHLHFGLAWRARVVRIADYRNAPAASGGGRWLSGRR